jgi:membrane protease subunit HflC
MNKWTITIITFFVVLFLVRSSVFIVKEGEYKVVTQFGEFVRISSEPGLRFKFPFIEDVVTLPKFQKIYDSQPTAILTKDKKPILVDNYTIWRIEDPEKFLRTLKTVDYGEGRIDAAVYNVVRRKLSEVEYGNIISENTSRGNLNTDITQEVSKLLTDSNFGIQIIDVRIKRTDLPEENKQSVYNRMISDRQSIAAGYLSEGDEESRKITSKADREVQELKAQAESEAKKIVAAGEQEAAQIYNLAYSKDTQFYDLYRTLDSYLTTLKGEPVIMMPINSPYTKILLGN